MLLLFLCSCSSHKKADKDNDVLENIPDTVIEVAKVVDIGRKDLPVYDECVGVKNKLSDIAEKIEFCALANEPSLNDELIGDIALTDEDIFILWKIDAVYRFNKSGDFMNKVGTKGQGPEEYIQPTGPFALDRLGKLLYVLDVAKRKICCYNYDGTFVKNIPAGNRPSEISLTDSSMFIMRTNDQDRYYPNTLALKFIDQNGKMVKSYKSTIYPIERENSNDWHYGSGPDPLWEYDGTYYSLEYGNDTIFRIEGTDMIADRTLSGTKYKPSLHDYFHSGTGDKRIIAPLLMLPNSCIFESSRFVLFRYYEEKSRHFLVYDKTDGKVYISQHDDAPRLKRTGAILSAYFTDDLVSGMPFNPEYQSNGKLIGWLAASDIMEKRDEILQYIESHPSEESIRFKDIVVNMEEEDNSVLMIVTLK